MTPAGGTSLRGWAPGTVGSVRSTVCPFGVRSVSRTSSRPGFTTPNPRRTCSTPRSPMPHMIFMGFSTDLCCSTRLKTSSGVASSIFKTPAPMRSLLVVAADEKDALGKRIELNRKRPQRAPLGVFEQGDREMALVERASMWPIRTKIWSSVSFGTSRQLLLPLQEDLRERAVSLAGGSPAAARHRGSRCPCATSSVRDIFDVVDPPDQLLEAGLGLQGDERRVVVDARPVHVAPGRSPSPASGRPFLVPRRQVGAGQPMVDDVGLPDALQPERVVVGGDRLLAGRTGAGPGRSRARRGRLR